MTQRLPILIRREQSYQKRRYSGRDDLARNVGGVMNSVAALCLIITSAAASGQPSAHEAVGESIYWVTLSDDITPEKLKKLRTDPEAARARYVEAVQRGTANPNLDERRLISFVDPSRNPELVTMHEAFRLFALGFTEEDTGTELQVLAVDRLTENGTSPGGTEQIVDAMSEFRARLDQGNDRLFSVRKRIERALQNVHNRMPYDAAEQLIAGASAQAKKGNVAAVAALLKISRDAAQEFVDFVGVDIGRIAVAPVLEELRDELPAADWNNLRSLLKSYVHESVGIMMEVAPQ